MDLSISLHRESTVAFVGTSFPKLVYGFMRKEIITYVVQYGFMGTDPFSPSQFGPFSDLFALLG